MKRIFLVPVLIFLFTASTFKEEKVLICLGSRAYAYHKRYCQGLKPMYEEGYRGY